MRKVLALGMLVTLGLAGRALAQAIPGVPTPPAVPTAAPAVPAAPAPATIWNKLGITKENCQKCREHCCKSPLGQMLVAMLKPLSFATGGLVGNNCCPDTPSAEDLAKLLDPNSNASPAEQAAAAIKADEAGAAARKAAVRYLGTVDCHYFPEAEGGLIAGLRQDRNECVRLEAALALSKGCCCTPKTIKALTIAANGTAVDGNPAETSERVKLAAMVALSQCMGRVQDKAEPPLPPERPLLPPEMPGPGKGEVTPAVYQAQLLDGRTQGSLGVNAGRLLAERAGEAWAPPQVPQTGQRNLIGLFQHARTAPAAQNDISFTEAALMAVPPR